MINSPIFRQHNTDTDFFRNWSCLIGFAMDFEIDETQHIVFWGYMDVHHRGLVQGVIGYAGALSIVAVNPGGDFPPAPTSSTPMGERVAGSTNGGNILSETDHYGKIIWGGSRLLQPGKYRVLAHANSHSSLAPNTDGLAETLVEGGAGLNCLIGVFYPA